MMKRLMLGLPLRLLGLFREKYRNSGLARFRELLKSLFSGEVILLF